METQTNKKNKNSLRKHIWRAIGILLLGILIGIGTAILFKKTEGIIGISSSIILSFLAVAFSYYQYYLKKIETEKRKRNDLKLMAYKELMKGCEELVTDCIKICLDRSLDKKIEIEIGIFIATLPIKISSFNERIKCYEMLLNTSIQQSKYENINTISNKLLEQKAIDKEMYGLFFVELVKTKIELSIYLLETLILYNNKI